jgi:hypothetical protein
LNASSSRIGRKRKRRKYIEIRSILIFIHIDKEFRRDNKKHFKICLIGKKGRRLKC